MHRNSAKAVTLVQHSNAQDLLISLLFIVFAVFFVINLTNKEEYSKFNYSDNKVAVLKDQTSY